MTAPTQLIGPYQPPDTSLVDEFDQMSERIRAALHELEARAQARARDLEIASEVSRQVSTVLDLDELLPYIATLTRDSFSLYHAHIYLLADDGQTLKLAAGAGEAGRQMVAEGRIIARDNTHSIVARCAREQRGIVSNHVHGDEHFLPHPLLPDTQSEMAIPMMVGGELVGVLDVQGDQPDRFTEEDVRIQTALAAQVAIAVQNARAFQVVQAAREDVDRIFNNSLDLIGSANFEGRFIRLNPAWERTLGWTLDDLLQHPFIEFVHPDDVDVTNSEAAKIAQGADTIAFTNRYRCKDGSYRRIAWNSAADVEHGMIHFIARDVTDQHAQQEYNATMAQISSALSQATDEQGILQPLTRIMGEVPGGMVLLGYINETDNGQPAVELIAAANATGAAMPLSAFPATHLTLDSMPVIEMMMQNPNEVLIIEDMMTESRLDDKARGFAAASGVGAAIIIPLLSGGKWDGFISFNWTTPQQFPAALKRLLAGVMPVVTSVVATRRAHLATQDALAEARRSREFLVNVLNATPDWIFAKDLEYRYTLINGGFARAIGHTVEDAVGRTDPELGFPDEIVFGDAEKGIVGFREDDIRVITRGETIHNPYDPAVFEDGTTHIFDTRKMPLRDSEGNIIGMLGYSRDITEREAQQEAMRQANQVIENSPAVLFRWRAADWGVEVVTENVRTFGYTAQQFLSGALRYADIIHPDDRDRVVRDTEYDTEQGQDGYNQEYRITTGDGEIRWVEEQTTIIRDEAGNAIFYEGVVIDITERTLALEEVNRQAAILDTSRDFIALTDMDYTIVYLNPGGAALMGFDSPAEGIGKRIPEYHTDEQAALVIEKGLPQLFETGRWQAENGLRRVDGTIVPVDQTLFLINDAQGNPQYIATIIADITERKAQQTELKKSEERFALAVEGANDGIWDWHIPTNTVYFSPRWKSMLGYAEDDVENSFETWRQLLHPEDLARGEQAVQDFLEGKTPTLRFEARMRHKDGSYRWILSQAAVVRDESGAPQQVAGSHSDITERKAQEEILRENQRRLSDAARMARLGYWEFNYETGNFVFTDEFYALVGTSVEAEGGYEMSAEEYASRFVRPDQAHIVAENVRAAMESDDPNFSAAFEAISIRADGREAVDYVQFHVVKDAEGRTIKLVGANQDITERKAQEEILRENQRRLSDAARMARLGYWEFNYETGNFVFTDEFYALVGTSVEAEGGYEMSAEEYASRFVRPDQAHIVAENVRAAMESDDPNFSAAFEAISIRADGREAVDYVQFHVVKDAAGRTIRQVGANQDITERKAQEEILRENQRRLSDAATIAGLGYWEFNYDTGKFVFTDEFYTLIGTSVEAEGGYEMSAEEYASRFVRADQAEVVGNNVRAAMESDDPEFSAAFESISIRADGREAVDYVQFHVVKDAEGRTIKLVGANQDITERKAQEQQIARRAAELATVAQVSAEAATNLDVDAVLWSVADLTKERFDLYHAHIYLLDADGQDLVLTAGAGEVGRRMVERGHRIPIDREHSIVARAARTHEGVIVNDVTQGEDFMANPDLPETVAEMAVPMIVGDKLIGVLDVQSRVINRFSDEDVQVKTTLAAQIAVAVQNARAYELSTRRAAELATVAEVSAATTRILEADALLQSVADLTKERFGLYHAHIYLLDDEGHYLMLTAGAGEAGREMKAHGHRIPINREHSIVARAARTREGFIVNDVTIAPDFLPNPLLPNTRSEMAIPMIVGDTLIGVLDVQSAYINRFTDEDLRVKSTLASQIAIAVRNARAFEYERSTADRLRDVDRLKSEFLASMSHELRTPLNSIIGYSEVMLEGIDGELPEDAIEDVRAIHSSGQHLLSIINDILDLAKIEAGRMIIDRKDVNLAEFLREISRAGEILLKSKEGHVALQLVEESPVGPVYADPVRLRQIIWNLMSNAIKFTEEGSVTVCYGLTPDNQAYIRVTDSGIGMKHEDLPLIFEQFRQVDGSSTRRAGGTGLGLSITRHLVHMHDGEIAVDSTLGEGSTFTVTLPLFTAEKVTR